MRVRCDVCADGAGGGHQSGGGCVCEYGVKEKEKAEEEVAEVGEKEEAEAEAE